MHHLPLTMLGSANVIYYPSNCNQCFFCSTESIKKKWFVIYWISNGKHDENYAEFVFRVQRTPFFFESGVNNMAVMRCT